MNKNFEIIINGLKNKSKRSDLKLILNRYEQGAATNKNFFENSHSLTSVKNSLMESVDITDPFIKNIIIIEAASAYSIFKYILDDNYSDILIYHDGMDLQDNREFTKWKVPKDEDGNIDEDFYEVYNIFVQHFVKNITYLSEQKFDVANYKLDAEVQGMRFNMIHGANTISGHPVIAIRKNLSSGIFNLNSDDYINSIGASEEQIKLIQKYAIKGTYIIFGEVGSGKTTLLRYMANYKLDEKSNLATIEDTPELNVNVPLAEITSHHASIHSLFVNTLRQYPSHVIIGETRTDEIVDILESSLTINVGTTIHAADFRKAIQRIIFMSLKRNIPTNSLEDLINASVNCFILMDKRKIKGMWVHKEEIERDIYKAYKEIK